MPSTFTPNLGIELPADGELDGVWGDVTNDNMSILDRAINGSVGVTLSGTSSTLTTLYGELSTGQFKLLVLGGSPSGTHTITIAPNDAQKIYFVRNTTAQSVVFTQGSGGNVTIATGDSGIIFSNGGGGAALVSNLTDHFSMSSVNITGGVINGTAVGATTASTGAFTTLALGGAAITSTAAELNILDGVTSSTAELNILDGVTATTAELNILDGVTATTAELNFVDGVTSAIQTQLDDKQPLQSNLTNLAAMTSSGIVVRNSSGAYVSRSITAGLGIVVTNGSGISGAPIIAADFASQAEAEAGTDNTKLMTSLRTKQAIDINADKLIATYTHTTNVTTISFINLGGWTNIKVVFANVGCSNQDNLIRLSTNNGSTYITTGYASTVVDVISESNNTTGFQFTRGSSGAISGSVEINNFGIASRKSSTGIVRVANSRQSVSAGDINLGVCDAFQISGSTYTGGTISVYGEIKV